MNVSGFKNIRNFIGYRNDDKDNRLKQIVSDVRKVRSFRDKLGFLRDSQWRPVEWHIDYQQQQLLELIRHAVRYVPFYRDIYNSRSIDLENPGPREILREIPIISKSDIFSEFSRLVPEGGVEKETVSFSLADNAGKSVQIPVDISTLIMDKAMVARHYENSGYRIGSPVLCFVDTIEGFENEKFYIDKANNRHYLSVNYLNRKNLSEYCARIKDSRSEFVFGYPGSLAVFVDFILEWEIDLRFYGVITSGGVLSDTVRDKIERAFDAKVYDLYRYSLPVTGMGQCQYCDGYHLFTEYCVTELVDNNGNTVVEEGKMGRIVITNTSNRAFPIIRLDTGDLGIYDGNSCDCGRGLPRAISKITGSSGELPADTAGEIKKAESLVKEVAV
jgi:phenylacetate-CoA ligase